MDIHLRLINHSYDIVDSSVVIFQRNVVADSSMPLYAWKTIKNLGRGDSHSFVYRQQVEVGAVDAWGNASPRFAALPGERWEVRREPSGDVLKRSRVAARDPREIEVYNGLPKGSIDAEIYRSGNLVLRQSTVSPGQKAVIRPEPKIYLAVISQVEQGAAMDAGVFSHLGLLDLSTEIRLVGYARADIVLKGGGGGPDAAPFQFTLSNVNEC